MSDEEERERECEDCTDGWTDELLDSLVRVAEADAHFLHLMVDSHLTIDDDTRSTFASEKKDGESLKVQKSGRFAFCLSLDSPLPSPPSRTIFSYYAWMADHMG